MPKHKLPKAGGERNYRSKNDAMRESMRVQHTQEKQNLLLVAEERKSQSVKENAEHIGKSTCRKTDADK